MKKIFAVISAVFLAVIYFLFKRLIEREAEKKVEEKIKAFADEKEMLADDFERRVKDGDKRINEMFEKNRNKPVKKLSDFNLENELKK